jgi:hypothetical protein
MKYNIEKINGIAEKLAEIIGEAITEADQTEIKIGLWKWRCARACEK